MRPTAEAAADIMLRQFDDKSATPEVVRIKARVRKRDLFDEDL